MVLDVIDVNMVEDKETLIREAKFLEGRTLSQVMEDIEESDRASRVRTKGNVGYVLEKGFFGIEKNSEAKPDIEHLGVEIKTCPLKFNKDRTRLSVKEPLSLNIINYETEHLVADFKDSSLYQKNHDILFIFYIHDRRVDRSQYLIKYVFLWHMDERVISELEPDYRKIIGEIKAGRAHKIHQHHHRCLTLCPKHSGKFKDPNCTKSKRKQPFSEEKAEVRAFRLKNSYMNRIICRELGKELGRGGWII